MRFGFYAGDTSKTIYVRLRDSTTGLAKTGLAYNSAGAIASYTLPLAARSAITLATQTVTGAWSSGGTFAAGVAGSQIVVIGVNLQEVAIAFLLIQSLWGQRAGGTAFDTGKAFPFP